MKSIILTMAILCLHSAISYSQLQVDVSAGYAKRPTTLSLKANGYFIFASPSLALNDKFRLHAALQFRQEIRESSVNISSIDISPAIEYDVFNFLSVSGGLYYSLDVSSLSTADRIGNVELGPVGMMKLKHKSTFLTLRYSVPVLEKIESYFAGDSDLTTTSFFGDFFQIGLGYTFLKSKA